MKTLLKYQLFNMKHSLIIFYGVLITVTLFFTGILNFVISSESGGVSVGSSQMSGLESATVIFLFVVGTSLFSETFHMFLQNGFTRKVIFKSMLLSNIVLCALMAVFDKLVLLLGKLSSSLFDQSSCYSLYEMIFSKRIADQPDILMYLENALFGFFLYLSFLMFGSFLALASYRGSRGLRIGLAVGIPVTLFLVFPLVDTFLDGILSSFILKVSSICFGFNSQNPYLAMLTCFVISSIFGFFNYLLIKKAQKH